MNKALQHHADGCEGDHGFGDFWQFFIVFGQAPPSSEPAKGSFNDPSARDHDEAGGAGDAAHDDQRQAEQEAGEQDRQPVVDAVGKDDREPAVEVLDLLQQIPGAVSVLDIGGVNNDTEQKAGGIDPDMALAALDLLGGIVAARPPFSVVFTVWLSRLPALGLASRPAWTRTFRRSRS